MFEEQYKKDNESIVPEEATKRYIKSKLKKEEEKAKPKFRYAPVLASVLCLVLAVGLLFIPKKPESEPQYEYIGQSKLMHKLTYADIYDKISGCFDNENNYYIDVDGALYLTEDLVRHEQYSTEPGASADDLIGSTGTNDGNESSTTNNQVQGVDESDLVKNDGRYIYSVKDGELIITDSNNGEPKIVSKTALTQNGETVTGLFVNGDRLAVIRENYRFSINPSNVTLLILDTSDKEQVKEVKSINQNGYYMSSRMIGDTVYLLSNHWVRGEIEKDKIETYIPCVDDKSILDSKISVIDDFTAPSYLVISALSIQSGEVLDSTAVLGGAENVYCNSENLYYTFTKSSRTDDGNKVEYKSATTIVKIKLGKELNTVATGTVPGRPLNQFSMDEYKGNLRIVTTVETQTTYKNKGDATASYSSTSDNALYVLDSGLKQIGAIERLAKGERVYSVRFDGEIGYFVTFRQVDPLFTVDLKDPTTPKILSELKIPGFSEYLHPFGEGKLFGFGKSATELGQVEGLKISMFDVSDPRNVTENHVTDVDSAWSEASENHKAIMVDVNKNIIAFLGTDYISHTNLYVYGYDEENGFFEKAVVYVDDSYNFGTRFVWINDHFYLVSQKGITVFSLDTFEKLIHLEF